MVRNVELPHEGGEGDFDDPRQAADDNAGATAAIVGFAPVFASVVDVGKERMNSVRSDDVVRSLQSEERPVTPMPDDTMSGSLIHETKVKYTRMFSTSLA